MKAPTKAELRQRIADLESDVLYWQKAALDPKVLIEERDGAVSIEMRHALI